jgi:hypothetical protein
MRFKVLLSVVAIVATTVELHAQYSADALRFSQTQSSSTARFKAIGAQTGVGGDLSSIGSNPAGIGLFTKSEFSITPEFNSYNADALYLGKNTVGKKDQIGLAHAAVVWNSTVSKPKGAKLNEGWISFNYGIGYNRRKSFGDNILFSGTNTQTSIADYYAQLATTNYGAPNSLPTGSLERMAYDNYLIGYDKSNGQYFPETDVNNVQTKNDLRTGSQGEFNFAFGANYSNQFYIGASIGIANINYTSNSNYKEKGFNVTENNNYDMSFRQYQITKGSGINAKLGAIYRPIPTVRLGATIESPTWYTINDSYSEVLDTKYGKNKVDSQFLNKDETYDFVYNLRTPLKISGGIGLFINNQGFISADVDYVDYSTINFSKAPNYDDPEVILDNNREILNNYKSAINYRLGAEYKIEKLMLRAGYGVQGNPYKALDNDKFKISTYSAGIGYRINNIYVDMTYQQMVYNSDIKPYTLNPGNSPIASIKNTRNNIFLTIGRRF